MFFESFFFGPRKGFYYLVFSSFLTAVPLIIVGLNSALIFRTVPFKLNGNGNGAHALPERDEFYHHSNTTPEYRI